LDVEDGILFLDTVIDGVETTYDDDSTDADDMIVGVENHDATDEEGEGNDEKLESLNPFDTFMPIP
jgi:hypothetical protein